MPQKSTTSSSPPASSGTGETSSLLGKVQADKSPPTPPVHHHHHGSASVAETIINETKTCMGTGCLALPYAARVGGLFLHVSGLIAIGLWNIYSVHRLCQCLQLLPKDAILEGEQAIENNDSELKEGEPELTLLELPPSPPPMHHRPHSEEERKYDSLQQLQQQSQQSTLSKVMVQARTVQSPPPNGTSTYSRVAWYAFGPIGLYALDFMMAALFIGVVVAFVNASRDFLRGTPVTSGSELFDAFVIAMIIGPMSAVPDTGYLARASAMGLIVLFLSFLVIAVYGLIELWEKDDDDIVSNLNWIPQDGIKGVSQWFGCVVFGYGIAPLTYNFRESMSEPSKMIPASTAALLIVAGSYVIIGVGLYTLFRDIDGDILHTLPATGWLPILTRLSMTVVVFVTAPLLIVPCGQLVEGKLLKTTPSSEVPYPIRATVRVGIALTCVSISVLVPGFVNVLSLVGCACVAAVGFVVPPLLFLRLRYMRSMLSWDLIGDAVMLVWGVVATLISTAYTFRLLTGQS